VESAIQSTEHTFRLPKREMVAKSELARQIASPVHEREQRVSLPEALTSNLLEGLPRTKMEHH